MSASIALKLENVNYTINGKTLLQGVNFDVKKGEVLAVLGHNGAGKSTLIDIITEDLKPDEGGKVQVLNGRFTKNKRRIGVVYDVISIFPFMKVKEILHYFSSLYNINYKSKVDLLDLLQIDKIAEKLFNYLSKGERKKVALFLSLVHEPELLILDEPTSDLDPLFRESVWRYILSEKEDRTVIFSTHLWEEAELFADRIVFIHKGKMLNTRPVSTKEILSQESVIGKKKIIAPKMDQVKSQLNGYHYIESDDYYHIFPKEHTRKVLQEISSITTNISVTENNLKDHYEWMVHQEMEL